MAGDASSYLRNKLLDHSLGTTAYTKPTAVYLAAFVGDPGGAGAEVSAVTHEEYVRPGVTFAAASDGSAASNADATFPVAAGDWGIISHLALLDAQTEGNLLWYGPMTQSKEIQSGDQLKVASGNFTASLT